MSSAQTHLETAIIRMLAEDGGYAEGCPSAFNANLDMCERGPVEFVQTTQPESWDGLANW